MAQVFYHCVSSAKRWGGDPEEYRQYHSWFDQSKSHVGDFRHRALRHHTQGIDECEKLFGPTFVNSIGVTVPVRLIAEQHVIEDLGFIPTLGDWLKKIKPEAWMNRRRTIK